MANFRIAAGRKKGDFTGYRFQDSDFGKWIEAVAYRLSTHPDPKLEREADRAIDLVADCQRKNGYLNTYFTITEPGQEWTDLCTMHELYVAGHLLEGAVAYYQATGKRKFLDVMIRNVQLIGRLFGRGKNQKRGYPGHQEIELALIKLYHVTGDPKHLELATYFIDERGRQPGYFDRERKARGEPPLRVDQLDPEYWQVHKPVREQTEAVGHAVRVMYMACGMADVARENNDRALVTTLRKLWRNVVDRRMYIIGGVGSIHDGEAFTYDYDLPNETSYAETCAAIGLVFWAQRMLSLEANGKYGDVMERALYNGVISGVSQDGRHFFYSNPLASFPHPRRPGSTLRPGWYGCACCPPNLARLLTSLGTYIYGEAPRTLFVHLYAESTGQFTVGKTAVELRQRTNYPWKEKIAIRVRPESPCRFKLAVRIPGWCRNPSMRINDERITLRSITRKGYAFIDRTWQKGDRVELTFPMPPERVYSRPEVRADAGRVALQRGPVVYCLEEFDNGPDLNRLALSRKSPLRVKLDSVGDICVPFIHARAAGLVSSSDAAFSTAAPMPGADRAITAIPYFLWANRGENEMLVWIRETSA